MTIQKKPLNALQAVLDRQASLISSSEPPTQPTRDVTTRTRKIARTELVTTSRAGKRLIGGHFPPTVAKHLKMLAAEEDTSVQALLEEALDLLFIKKGKGHIN